MSRHGTYLFGCTKASSELRTSLSPHFRGLYTSSHLLPKINTTSEAQQTSCDRFKKSFRELAVELAPNAQIVSWVDYVNQTSYETSMSSDWPIRIPLPTLFTEVFGAARIGNGLLHHQLNPLCTPMRSLHLPSFLQKRATAAVGRKGPRNEVAYQARSDDASKAPNAAPDLDPAANNPGTRLSRNPLSQRTAALFPVRNDEPCARGKSQVRPSGRDTATPSVSPLGERLTRTAPLNPHRCESAVAGEKMQHPLHAVVGPRKAGRCNNRTTKRRALVDGSGTVSAAMPGRGEGSKTPRTVNLVKRKSSVITDSTAGGGPSTRHQPTSAASSPTKKTPEPVPETKKPAPGAVDAAQQSQKQRGAVSSPVPRLPKSALQPSFAWKRIFIPQRRQQRELLKKIQCSKAPPNTSEAKQNSRSRCQEVVASDAATSEGAVKLKRKKPTFPASTSEASVIVGNPLYFPDYREQVLVIFQRLAEINLALGEKYKTQSYQVAMERLKKEDTIFKLLPPHLKPLPENFIEIGDEAEVKKVQAKRAYALDSSKPIAGVGKKLRQKIVEILSTGDLAELHALQAKPMIRAIRELTQVHGFGPRTAMTIYKDYGINTVEKLKAYAEEHGLMKKTEAQESETGKKVKAAKGILTLTDAQRFGLQYYEDIQQRIPYNECRLHEAFLKLRLRKYLGRDYDLTVCGSYRRKVPTSGDIDVLITRSDGLTNDADPLASSQNALSTFTSSLQAEGYIEASLAQGPTKFMGVCRFRSLKKTSAPEEPFSETHHFHARRIDIRFVDAASYPAALLYFTGSKNFNVIMRAEAIKKNFILNEYGLFRNNSSNATETGKLHEMIGQLSKAQYYTTKKGAVNYSLDSSPIADDEAYGSGIVAPTKRAGRGGGKTFSGKVKEQGLLEVLQKVEALRVEVKSESHIFEAIGMRYVDPENRNV